MTVIKFMPYAVVALLANTIAGRGVLAIKEVRTIAGELGEKYPDKKEIFTKNADAYIKKLTHITALGNLAVKMVRESVNSFINNDEALADEVIALDDQMDDLFIEAKTELIELIKKDGNNGDQGIELMMVAKYLERIGDHAVNVAEWTKYNETGVHQKF